MINLIKEILDWSGNMMFYQMLKDILCNVYIFTAFFLCFWIPFFTFVFALVYYNFLKKELLISKIIVSGVLATIFSLGLFYIVLTGD